MDPIVIIFVGLALVVVIIVGFAFIDKFIKGDFKKKPAKFKEVEKESIEKEALVVSPPDTIIQEGEAIEIPTPEEKPREEPAPQRTRSNRIAEYHKRKWADREIRLDNIEYGQEDGEEFTITKQDFEKLAALRDLFDNK